MTAFTWLPLTLMPTQILSGHNAIEPTPARYYPKLLELMKHDKKNTSGTINFSLLANIGDVKLNQTASEEEIKEALDFIREG